MKKTYSMRLLILLMAIGLLSSCGTYSSYFGNGYHSLESSYLDKPFYDSLPQGAWYVSAKATWATGYNLNFSSSLEGDKNRMFQAIGHRGYTYRNISGAYGLFGYYGNYRIGNQHDSVLVDSYLTRRSYYGFGGKATISWNIPFQKVNFRPLGIEVTLNHEFGRYLAFVRQLNGQHNQVHTIEDPLSVNFGLTSELCIRLPNHMSFGYHMLLAIPDRDYQALYSYTNASGEKESSIFGGGSTTFFLGTNNTLFQMQVGVGEAQLFVAGSVTYRLK